MSEDNEGFLKMSHSLTITVDGRVVLHSSIGSNPDTESQLCEVLEELIAFMKAPKTEITNL